MPCKSAKEGQRLDLRVGGGDQRPFQVALGTVGGQGETGCLEGARGRG